MGQARFPVESLAVLPVLNALTFIFRSIGLSFQEVVIVLIGENQKHLKELTRFAMKLAAVTALAYALIAYTPLVIIWYHAISGLSMELTQFALTPTRILPILPALAVLLSFQRGFLVHTRMTRPITWATIIEISGIVLVLMVTIHVFDVIGATAAAVAFVTGRVAGNLYLVSPCLRGARSGSEILLKQ